MAKIANDILFVVETFSWRLLNFHDSFIERK